MLKIVQTLAMDGARVAPADYLSAFAARNVTPDFRVVHCTSEDELIAACADADIVFGQCSVQRFSRRVLTSLRACRMIVSMGIGFENLDREAATEAGILVANVPDFCLEEVADHTLALILACTRRVVALHGAARDGGGSDAIRRLREHHWPRMSRLRGRTLGLVGFGAIARAVVPRAAGFGLNVIACDPYVDADAMALAGVRAVSQDELLAGADIVSLHAPLNEGNRHLLGAAAFARMKPGAIVINTGRGGLIDHAALSLALRGGTVAAAGLDVTEPEPLPPEHELWRMDQVVITPHSAGISPEAMSALVQRPWQETLRLLDGDWPAGWINPGAKAAYRARWR